MGTAVGGGAGAGGAAAGAGGSSEGATVGRGGSSSSSSGGHPSGRAGTCMGVFVLLWLCLNSTPRRHRLTRPTKTSHAHNHTTPSSNTTDNDDNDDKPPAAAGPFPFPFPFPPPPSSNASVASSTHTSTSSAAAEARVTPQALEAMREFWRGHRVTSKTQLDKLVGLAHARKLYAEPARITLKLNQVGAFDGWCGRVCGAYARSVATPIDGGR